MDAALANSPGPVKKMGGAAPGYPVDQLSPAKGYFGGYFPEQHAPVNDLEHGRGGLQRFCCGCSKRTAIIASVVLAVLLLAGVGLGAGLGIGLQKSNGTSPPPPAIALPPPAPPPGIGPIRPDCTSDQECSVKRLGVLCFAGSCITQQTDSLNCNKTLGSLQCYSGTCGDKSALGISTGLDPFACLLTTGNRCKRSEACASEVCKELGAGSQAGRYCVAKSGVTDQPPKTVVIGSPCKVDVHCGGATARCIQGQCTNKADYPEACATGTDCFSGACIFNAATESDSCAVADGGLCRGGTSAVCKKSSACSSDGYCESQR